MRGARGSSGAIIQVGFDQVGKYDTELTFPRVREQGEWLSRLDGCKILPQVLLMHSDGYEMEKLTVQPIPTDEKTIFRYCDDIIAALEHELWSRRDFPLTLLRPTFDLRGHRRYVRRLLRQVNLTKYRGELTSYVNLNRIDWHDLRHVTITHGDAIIDNLLWRQENLELKPVLIDPIPSCPAIPDFAAVDAGRVIQSAIGYEVLRYRSDVVPPDITDAVRHVLNTWQYRKFSVNEARAALHFAIIHMMRGVRTAQRVAPDCARALRWRTEQLIEETRGWMR